MKCARLHKTKTMNDFFFIQVSRGRIYFFILYKQKNIKNKAVLSGLGTGRIHRCFINIIVDLAMPSLAGYQNIKN